LDAINLKNYARILLNFFTIPVMIGNITKTFFTIIAGIQLLINLEEKQ